MLTGLMGQSAAQGREFLASLPPGDRGPALGATAGNTKSTAALQDLIALSSEIPEKDRAVPLTGIAARIAQSTSLTAGAAVFDTLTFSNPGDRATAARDVAIASAINKKDDSPVRQDAAWEWLTQQSSGDSQRQVQAEFLAKLAGNDASWALERFESIGGAAAGQEALRAFLRNVPRNNGEVSPRYFALATQLTDPAEQEAALGQVVHRWKQLDQEAARQAVDAAALPDSLKARIWTARD
jgi:hypothetical protein